MRHHGAPLLRRELGWIVKDVGERFVELSDVVEERDSLDTVQSLLVEPSGFAEEERVSRNTTDVSAGDGIVGVDGVEQCLERGRAKAFGVGANAMFAIKQPTRRCADC